MDYRIFPPDELIEARVALPLSKSMSNRALAIAALTVGGKAPEHVADCDDTRAMERAAVCREGSVDVGAAGTAMRFMTAVYAATPGVDVTLDGSERMRHRPIEPLVDALRACGADIEYVMDEGYPPLHIRGRHLTGGEVSVAADCSSQFVSALLMAAPTMERGMRLKLAGEPVSAAYVDMTLAMMQRAGADVCRTAPGEITVEPQPYKPVELTAEPDWSAAAFWYEAEALTSGWITVDALDARSVQGDSAVARIFSELGVTTEYDGEEPGTTELAASPDVSPRLILDMTDTPDLVQPTAVTCALLNVPFRFSGLRTLRIKETDRIAALETELLKIGVEVTVEGDDVMWWEGRRHPVTELPVFDTYDDHRMAMSFAMVAVYAPGIIVRDTEVVAKSYPGFWEQLEVAGFRLVDALIPLDELQPDEEGATE